jgi:hypothetical protein
MKRLFPVLYLCLLFPTTAHAYADPGSGLMLWQLTVSFVIGLLFYVKRVAGFLGRLFKREE